jgi:hypothetical protein
MAANWDSWRNAGRRQPFDGPSSRRSRLFYSADRKQALIEESLCMQNDRVGGRTHARKPNFWERVLNEVKRLVVIFLYLWVIFGLFVLNERIILRQRGMAFTLKDGFAIINALALAKVMLVAEDMNLVRWIRSRPLIYPILLESTLLTIILVFFNIVERLAVGLLERKTVAASVPAVGGGGLVGLVCVSVILFVALIPFIAFRHVSRELGSGRLNAMLFGTKAPDNR